MGSNIDEVTDARLSDFEGHLLIDSLHELELGDLPGDLPKNDIVAENVSSRLLEYMLRDPSPSNRP
jgi:hypothetical protein